MQYQCEMQLDENPLGPSCSTCTSTDKSSVESPLVSVVLPFRGTTESLRCVLLGLACQTLPKSAYEVLIVDHASTGDARSVACLFEDEINIVTLSLSEVSMGAAAPRNLGAQQANGNVLVFLDADVAPHPRLLEEHAEAHTLKGRKLVLGKILALGMIPAQAPGLDRLPHSPKEYHNWMRNLLTEPWANDWRCAWLEGCAASASQPPVPWCFVWSGNMSLPKSLFESLGGFSVSLPRHEDLELGIRAEFAGIQICFDASAIGAHLPHHRASTFHFGYERKSAERLFYRYPSIGTEILAAGLSRFTCLDPTAWLPIVQSLPSQRALDHLPSAIPDAVKGLLKSILADPVLLVGCGDGSGLALLECAMAVDCDKHLSAIAFSDSGTCVIMNLLGLRLPVAAKHFSCAIIGYLPGCLPLRLLTTVVEESLRVANKVFLAAIASTTDGASVKQCVVSHFRGELGPQIIVPLVEEAALQLVPVLKCEHMEPYLWHLGECSIRQEEMKERYE